jgi:hypothetical protein
VTSGNPYTFVESTGWQAYTPAEAREYLRRQGVGLAVGRATPFLNDSVSRRVFDIVTLDSVKDE